MKCPCTTWACCQSWAGLWSRFTQPEEHDQITVLLGDVLSGRYREGFVRWLSLWYRLLRSTVSLQCRFKDKRDGPEGSRNDGVKPCCVTSRQTIINPHSLSRCRVILLARIRQNVVSPPLPVFVDSWNTLIRCFCPSCKMNHTVGRICIRYFIHWSCSGHNSWYYSLIQISLVSYWHIQL